MNLIKPPIVIVDRRGNDINIHASIEDAQLHLEAIDVKNNEYTAYDSEGRLLALDVVIDKTSILFGFFQTSVERVRIRQAEDDPFHADELRTALFRFLKALGVVDNSLSSENMDQLIERVMEVIPSREVKRHESG
jgi:hypothetical protein